MRTVRISDEVYDEIAKRGRFGQTVDDVLRSAFGLQSAPAPPVDAVRPKNERSNTRSHHAKLRMSARIERDRFSIEFANGQHQNWPLPDRSDKPGIRALLEQAWAFAESQGASEGQINAVRKVLTDAGYHLRK